MGKLRLEYWTKRLDHTLTHTQSASRLIYIVDGAVLALLAFVIEKLSLWGPAGPFLAIPVAFLALLNYYHAELIKRQHAWYKAIDERIRDVLEQESDLILTPPGSLGGTHDIYTRIHQAIAWFLMVTALAIPAYALVLQ